MTKKSIDFALDRDLRLSHHALLRAAQRARVVAFRTGTAVVISRNGVLVHIDPADEEAFRGTQPPALPLPAER